MADLKVSEQHMKRYTLISVLLNILDIYSFNNLAKIKEIHLTTYIVQQSSEVHTIL